MRKRIPLEEFGFVRRQTDKNHPVLESNDILPDSAVNDPEITRVDPEVARPFQMKRLQQLLATRRKG